MGIYQKLSEIQAEMSVKKSKWNEFGGFHYRSLDDILSSLKPYLKQYGLLLTMDDSIIEVGGRVYVEATVTLVDVETGEKIITKAGAREALSKAKMDDAQVTGSSSTYARKYALGGLLALDNDDNDPDSMDNTPNGQKKQTTGKQDSPSQGQYTRREGTKNEPKQQSKGKLSDKQINRANAKMNAAGLTPDDVSLWIEKKFQKTDISTLTYNEYNELCDALDKRRGNAQ